MKPDARDILALLGVALIATAAGFVYWPLALAVPGAFCLWLGLWRRRGVD